MDSKDAFKEIAKAMGETVVQKNTVYGNSFGKSADFIKLLYPNGIQPHQYNDILLIARIFDKLVRIATGAEDEESPYLDIGGYAILGHHTREASGAESDPDFLDNFHRACKECQLWDNLENPR